MLLAPSALKGSFTARAAARAMATGLSGRAHTRSLPVADGGDGTAAVLARALGGRPVTVRAADALGIPRRALAFRLTPAGGAVDLAGVCGIRRLWRTGRPPDPLGAGTRGLGEALLALARAVPAGPLYVGLGGSASTDGGAGLLAALGGRLLDRRGQPLPPGGAALKGLARIDLRGVDPALVARLVPLADVSSPLLGPLGAAASFAPQKGADADAVRCLEEGLERLREAAERDLGVPPALAQAFGAGAAGGTGYAFLLLGAPPRPGAATVLDLVHFDAALTGVAAVLAAEGRLDATSLSGKAPVAAARRARAAGVPAAVVCARAQPEAARRLEGEGIVVAVAAPPGGRAGAADLGRAAARALARLLPAFGYS
ncbi:MAG: glycerate kinase [Firmicutes bacterium]|nr:glycerate kinase [Bacillota bacterium]